MSMNNLAATRYRLRGHSRSRGWAVVRGRRIARKRPGDRAWKRWDGGRHATPPTTTTGRPAAAGCAVAAHPTSAAATAWRWRAPDRPGSGLHGRDPVHVPHLHPLGAAAGQRVRLRVGDDLLEPVRGV